MEFAFSSTGSAVKSSGDRVRVLVEDPELTPWQVLQEILPSSSGFIVVPRAGGLDQILEDCQRIAPCVLLASYELIRSASRDSLRDRLIRTNGVRMLVRGAVSRDTAEMLLAAGVMGLIPVDGDGALIRKAILSVERGEIWAGRLVVSSLIRKLRVRLTSKDLSERELEILELITKGLSNREIAEKLFISRDTVQWHIRGLYSKIGLNDRADAVRYGKEILVAVAAPEASAFPPALRQAQARPPECQMAAH